MKCPVDSIDLIMSERSGVEIDYCPQCRGVWLDRGELDKIIDRSADSLGGAAAPPARPPAPAPGSPVPALVPPPLYQNFEPRREQPSYDDRREQPRHDDRSYGKKGYDRDDDRRGPKKKEGWLGDLFDF
ncbi:zf-TFIIB domain-containing protein [Micrococcaceae bacterium Sec5.7]